MSKLFGLFNWVVTHLEGSHLGKLPFTYLAHELIYTRLAPKGETVLTESGPYRMYTNSRDKGEVTTALLNRKKYFPFLTSTIESLVPRGGVCIDVGAHIGYYTLLMARTAGENGRVYSFEPAPLNYRMLLKNVSVSGCTNIVPSNRAVSSKNGSARLLINRVDLEGNFLLTRKALSTLGFRTLEVKTVALDSLFKGKVDLVKVDVEGAEPLVLEGMSSLVLRNKGIPLVFEFLPAALRKVGTSPEVFLQKITSLGLCIFNIDESKKELYPVTPEFLLSAYKGANCTNILLRHKEQEWKTIE